FSSQAIKRLLEGATEQDLEGLLSGGVRVELVPDRGAGTLEERAAFLKRLRGAAGLDPVTTASPSGDPKVPGDPKAETKSLPPVAWSRIELHDGLELH